MALPELYDVSKDIKDKIQEYISDKLPTPKAEKKKGAKVATALGAGALGVGATGTALRHIAFPKDYETFASKAKAFTELGNPALISEEAFPYMYAQKGHELANTPFNTMGKSRSAGNTITRLRNNMAAVLGRLTGKPMGRDLGEVKASLDHYRTFSRSPVEAYRLMAFEAQATSPVGELRDLISQVTSKYPQSEWNKQLSKRIDLAHVRNPNITGFRNKVSDVLGRLLERIPSQKLHKNPAYRDLYNRMQQKVVPNFMPFLEQQLRYAGLDPTKKYSSQQINSAIKQAWDKAGIPDYITLPSGKKYVNTVYNQINRYIRDKGFTTITQLRHKPHPLQKFVDVKIAARMRAAPANYGRILNITKIANAMSKKVPMSIAFATFLAGIYSLNRTKDK